MKIKKISADLRHRVNVLAHLEGQLHATKRRAEMLAELQEHLNRGTTHGDLIEIMTRWEHGGNLP